MIFGTFLVKDIFSFELFFGTHHATQVVECLCNHFIKQKTGTSKTC